MEDLKSMGKCAKTRWLATVTYRTENGSQKRHFGIEELDELASIVERGRDWMTILEIKAVLRRSRSLGSELTIERAARLTVADVMKFIDLANAQHPS